MRTPPRPIPMRSLTDDGPAGPGAERMAREARTRKAAPAPVWARSLGSAGALALVVTASLYGCGLPLGGLQSNSTFPEDADPPGDGTDAADPPDAPIVTTDAGGLDDGPTDDVTVPPDPVHDGGHDDRGEDKPPPADAGVDPDGDKPLTDAGADSAPDAPPDAPPDAKPDAPMPPPPPPMPPTFIQLAPATPQGAVMTITAAFMNAQTAGNTNVLAIGWADATAHVLSVTDKAGNAYTLALGPTVAINPAISFTQSMYYASAIAASPANAVTVTFDANASAPDLRVAEYQGLDPDAPVDVSAGAAGTGLTTTAGPVTTNGPALLVGANMVPVTTLTAGAGFTQRIITKPDSDIFEDRYVPMAGSYSATALVDNGVNWVMQLVAFRVK